MKKIVLVLCFMLIFAGCSSFLTPIHKLDADGKPIVVALGSEYLEGVQGIAQTAATIPLLAPIASGVAAVLGIGIGVLNRIASNSKTALVAAVTGISTYDEKESKVKSAIMERVSGLKDATLTKDVGDLLSSLSVKHDVNHEAYRLNIGSYLNTIVQKIDPKKIT